MSRVWRFLRLGLLSAALLSFTLLGAARAEQQDSTQEAAYAAYKVSSSGAGLSGSYIKYETGATGMVIDGLVVRPLSFVGTVLGTLVFVATLPFSTLGGNVGESAELLVLEPAKFTFGRCLGCWPERSTH